MTESLNPAQEDATSYCGFCAMDTPSGMECLDSDSPEGCDCATDCSVCGSGKSTALLVHKQADRTITVYWNESRLFHVYEGDKEIEVFTSMEPIEDALAALEFANDWWHGYGEHYTQRTV